MAVQATALPLALAMGFPALHQGLLEGLAMHCYGWAVGVATLLVLQPLRAQSVRPALCCSLWETVSRALRGPLAKMSRRPA